MMKIMIILTKLCIMTVCRVFECNLKSAETFVNLSFHLFFYFRAQG